MRDDDVDYQVQEALERGGRLLVGGRADGPFFHPTLIEFDMALLLINEGPLYGDYSLPIGGIRDSGLNGSTDKIEEMAYTKRVHLAT